MTKIENAFDEANAVTDNFNIESLGQKFKMGAGLVKGGKYGVKLINNNYGGFSQDLLNDATAQVTGYISINGAKSMGIGTAAAKLIGQYSAQTVGLVLVPLTAEAPVSPSSQRRSKETAYVRAKTISALLFKFMNNNIPTKSLNSLPRAISDHPEDKIKVLRQP